MEEKDKKKKEEKRKKEIKSLEQANKAREPKENLKNIGTTFEAAQATLKYFYIPFFFFAIFLGPTLLGTIFGILFFASFMASEIIGSAIKDEFKDTADKLSASEAKESLTDYATTLHRTKELEAEIAETEERLTKKGILPKATAAAATSTAAPRVSILKKKRKPTPKIPKESDQTLSLP